MFIFYCCTDKLAESRNRSGNDSLELDARRQYGVSCPTSSVRYLQVAGETDDNYLDHSRFAFWCTYGFIETL